MLSGASPDFSGLLQAFAQPMIEDAPSPAVAEAPTEPPAAPTADEESDEQPTRRDAGKTVRATAAPLAQVAPRAPIADETADDAAGTDCLSHTTVGADASAPAIKPDSGTDNATLLAEAAPPPETRPEDAVLTWLAGQQALTVPKIVASQKATPAPTDSAASAGAAAPINVAPVIAPMPQDAPVEAADAPAGLMPGTAPTPDFKQPSLLRAAPMPVTAKAVEAGTPAPTADAAVASTALPPPVKNAEPEVTRALAAQAVPEGNGNAPTPVAPPQGIAPVSIAAAPVVSPPAARPADSARNVESNFSGLDALSGGRGLNGYQGATPLGSARATRPGSLPATAVVEQVAIKLHQQAQSGLDQLTIQLRPADLGRVDIKLQFHDGSVTGTIIADSQATLDLLQKDQRSLERALQESGLRTDPGALSFTLRDPSGQGQQAPSNGRSGGRTLTAEVLLADAGEADGEAAIITANRVNLRV